MRRILSLLLALTLLVPISAVAAEEQEENIFGSIFRFLVEGFEEVQADTAENPPGSLSREEALDILMDYPSMDFTLNDLDGNAVTLSELQGKIVLISIWATWCGPCQMEMPHFETINAENDDLVILAVHSAPYESGDYPPSEEQVAEAEAACRAFIEENGYTFPVLLDVEGTVSLSSTYRTNGIPGNFILDREGVIRYAQEGAFVDEESIMTVIDYVRSLG